jgi:hypothetical protein
LTMTTLEIADFAIKLALLAVVIGLTRRGQK